MHNKLFFFPLGLCVVLVFLTGISGCARFDLSDFFPWKEDASEADEPQATNPQTPPSQQTPSQQTPSQQDPLPQNPPLTSPQYTWYVSSSGKDTNAGAADSSPLASVSVALTRIRSAYRGGQWPAGMSAVIVVEGRIVGGSSFGANESMVDISGVGNYPPIILKGDPINGGILDANKTGADGRVLYIADNKVTLGEKLVLTGGRTLWGGAVCVGMHGTESAGEFIVDGGEISGNSGGNGGAVMVYKGSMSMKSGVIKNNDNDFLQNHPGDGGAIYVMDFATLRISGGTISDNGSTAKTYNGGGVYVNGEATAIMTGGEILRNTSSKTGGGVYIASDGTFTMSGGTISGNKSKIGGGVGETEYGVAIFNKTGGTISGNTPN